MFMTFGCNSQFEIAFASSDIWIFMTPKGGGWGRHLFFYRKANCSFKTAVSLTNFKLISTFS